MQDRRIQLAEELRTAQQLSTHLKEVERLAKSYPMNHPTQLLVQSMGVSRVRSIVEGDIVTLRGALSSGSSGP